MTWVWPAFLSLTGFPEVTLCERLNMSKITEIERIREKFLCILSQEKTRCVVMIEHLWCDFVASINVATELANILFLIFLPTCLVFLLFCL